MAAGARRQRLPRIRIDRPVRSLRVSGDATQRLAVRARSPLGLPALTSVGCRCVRGCAVRATRAVGAMLTAASVRTRSQGFSNPRQREPRQPGIACGVEHDGRERESRAAYARVVAARAALTASSGSSCCCCWQAADDGAELEADPIWHAIKRRWGALLASTANTAVHPETNCARAPMPRSARCACCRGPWHSQPCCCSHATSRCVSTLAGA
jgi:hypothetical protein